MTDLYISNSSRNLANYLDGVDIFPPLGKLQKSSNTLLPVKASNLNQAKARIYKNLDYQSKKLLDVFRFNLVVFQMKADDPNNVSGVDFWCYSIAGQKRI